MEERFYIDPKKYYGRPVRSTGAETAADPIDRIPAEMACYDLLDSLGIVYGRVDHSHADTIEACHEVEKVLGWPVCKNLFLCNRQKTSFYLLTMPEDKPFLTKNLSQQIGSSRLSFAPAEDMERLLGCTPGSASVLGLMNDKEHQVRLIMDKDVYEAEWFGCHPCKNDGSLRIKTADLLNVFLPHTGHTVTVVEL